MWNKDRFCLVLFFNDTPSLLFLENGSMVIPECNHIKNVFNPHKPTARFTGHKQQFKIRSDATIHGAWSGPALVRGLSGKPNTYVSWSTSELRVRLAPLNRFKPSSKIFYWPFQGGTSFVDLFMFLLCLVFAMSLRASVYMCFVVTCWERADLLALVCGV